MMISSDGGSSAKLPRVGSSSHSYSRASLASSAKPRPDKLQMPSKSFTGWSAASIDVSDERGMLASAVEP